MGIFDKFKNIFKKEEKTEVELYDKGLEKTRDNFLSALLNLNKNHKIIDDDYFENLEEILIMSDIGVNTVMEIIDRLKKRVKKENIQTSDELKDIIVDEMFIIYVGGDIITNKINYAKEGPTIILFVGVNGAGKTTTIGKLAHKLKSEGKKVLLVAGDTFRAGAKEQLDEWASTTKCDIVYKENADPVSVMYDGVTKAKEENYDIVLIDTAGRLQNKIGLMKELEKMNASLKSGDHHETL